jgi:hypothetical protein
LINKNISRSSCIFCPQKSVVVTICPAHHCSNKWKEDDSDDLLVQHDVKYQGRADGVDVEHGQLVQLFALDMEEWGDWGGVTAASWVTTAFLAATLIFLIVALAVIHDGRSDQGLNGNDGQLLSLMAMGW